MNQQLNQIREKLEQIPGYTKLPEQIKEIIRGHLERVAQKLKEGGLTTLLDVFRKHFKVSDVTGFIIVIACAVAHQMPGEALWVRVFGGSRSGKTELLRAIAKHRDSVKMEHITPASIRGGLEKGHRLLERINGKLVITKDLASMLTNKREVRNEVFGLLRNVKDGELVSDFGTEGEYLHQEATFDWLIGTTPVFAQYRQMEDLLGSRFIDLNWQATDREEMTLKALENNETLNSVIRPEIAEAVGKLIDRAKDKQRLCPIELDDDTKKMIVDLADLTALLRSPVARDYQHRVKFHPEPEVGTSLAQDLGRITKSLMLLEIPDIPIYLVRLCMDSIPYERRELIRKLLENRSVNDPKWSYIVDDLRLLGVLDSNHNILPDLRDRLKVMFAWSGS